jgi:hypothetical protein
MGGDFGVSSNVYANITPNGAKCSRVCQDVCRVFSRKPATNNFLSDGAEVNANCMSACLKGLGFKGRAYLGNGKYSTEEIELFPIESCLQEGGAR